MTRERGIMQSGVRRQVQLRGSGREEARLMSTSAPPPRGWARQEAGGKAAAEVSLLLMKILRSGIEGQERI